MTAGDLIKQPLPDLSIGPRHTVSSALQDDFFVAGLREWTDFARDVRTTCQNQTWNRRRNGLCHTTVGVRLGDETGVQGQFQQNVGNTMSSIFQVFGFVDYKASSNPRISGRVPDVVIMTESTGNLRVVGEVKTPWIRQHNLRSIYGFLSTYEQTIFLKQEEPQPGTWELHYSPVILAETTAAPTFRPDADVSVRECFLS
ncbi:hypothetical protein V8E54_014000 [Elaphomyces granulatus]